MKLSLHKYASFYPRPAARGQTACAQTGWQSPFLFRFAGFPQHKHKNHLSPAYAQASDPNPSSDA